MHSSDLQTLQPSCRLATLIKDSPSSRQLPHVERSPGSSLEVTSLFTTRCGSIAIDVAPGSGEWDLEADKKHVLSISLPPIEGSPRYRKTVMVEHGSCSSDYHTYSMSNSSHVQNDFSPRSWTDSLPLLRTIWSFMLARISRWNVVNFLRCLRSTRHRKQRLHPPCLLFRHPKGGFFTITNSLRQPLSLRFLSRSSS